MGNWTADELAKEHEYRRVERLGILLAGQPETLSASFIAETEADEVVEKLRGQNG
jgi:hypothetical protein